MLRAERARGTFRDTKLKPTRFNLSVQPRPTDVTSSWAISPRLKSEPAIARCYGAEYENTRYRRIGIFTRRNLFPFTAREREYRIAHWRPRSAGEGERSAFVHFAAEFDKYSPRSLARARRLTSPVTAADAIYRRVLGYSIRGEG